MEFMPEILVKDCEKLLPHPNWKLMPLPKYDDCLFCR